MKEEKQLPIDDEMPKNWPNPGWPGCPGPGRYRMAQKLYLALTKDQFNCSGAPEPVTPETATPGPETPRLQTPNATSPDIPGATNSAMRRAHLDAQIILDLEDGYRECEEYNSRDEKVESQFFILEEFHDPAKFARGLSTDTTIGLLIIRNAPTGLEVGCTVLSRHRRWMGHCPYLEDLRNTDVIVHCHQHRPDAVVVIPRNTMGYPEPGISPCTQGEKMLSGREARFLDRIIRFHGGNPIFIDLCRKNQEKWGNGELNIRLIPMDEGDEMEIPQDCYPFHNGPVTDWKN